MNTFLDIFCAASIFGIWPRFIEPKLLKTTRLNMGIDIKILQFSDLHFHPGVSQKFLDKLSKKIGEAAADLIVFTGDFLCYSRLEDKERLKTFLNSLSAPLGCYAILGNHDYAANVTIDDAGNYTITDEHPSFAQLIKRLFIGPPKKRKVTERAFKTPPHEDLLKLLKETPFEVLHNKTKVVGNINLTGLGEYMYGRCLPEEAFKDFDKRYPGVVLAHNPDSITKLQDYPGEIILCGHTHGAQINLPWIWRRFVLLENMRYKRGLYKEGGKSIYVNRGVGSTVCLRLFSIPEILVIEAS